MFGKINKLQYSIISNLAVITMTKFNYYLHPKLYDDFVHHKN